MADIVGTVDAVLVDNRGGQIYWSGEKDKISVVLRHGVKGGTHAGSRLADVREKAFLEFGLMKGMEIANHREFSAVSFEEVCDISRELVIPQIQRGVLGENLVLRGIPNLTKLPIGSLLFFRKGSTLRTAVLMVMGENTPCIIPGEGLQLLHPDEPQLAARFVKAAMGRRGVVGLVYSSGFIARGDEVVVKIPKES